MTSYNNIKVFDSQDLAVAGDADGLDIVTSSWIDISGWENKVIAWEADANDTDPPGTPALDLNITAHISSQHAYELNNKTATTEDYVAVTIVNAHTGVVYFRQDGTDFDDLLRPVRAIRFIIENDEATYTNTVNLWIEGRS